MILHLLEESLLNAILITGLVTIMMMMIESLNIESKGRFFSSMGQSRVGGVLVGAFLGVIPGCLGGFATVSLYTHNLLSFGALVAMMIASAGDEAFVMLATIPGDALWIFALLFGISIVTGLLTDLIFKKKDNMRCTDDYSIHTEDESADVRKERHFGWKRVVMFVGILLFLAALVTGHLEHEHGGGEIHEELVGGINLLSEDWMNIMFAILSILVLVLLVCGSDHFVNEHLWHHVVVKHLPTIFAWTFGVLVGVGLLLNCFDISSWISENTVLMILLATAIGIIPESGPHLIFVTLYASGIVPLPVLLASCISQDGHASLPLIAESKKSFLKAKLVNCTVALAVGFTAMLFV
ncbi:MAG: putative manganese transporter [Bacteroidales bacterium]|nr:putative manganese transporter [Bacteroidales bacterium]